MSEFKLNEWRWGVVPTLDPYAVVLAGGSIPDSPGERPILMYCIGLNTCDGHEEDRWYAVLSLGPPTMPEPELRLPDGWKVTLDSNFEVINGHHIISVEKMDADLRVFCNTVVRGATRRECIERVNEILGGGK